MAAKVVDSLQSLMIVGHVAKDNAFDLISMGKTSPRLDALCRLQSFWVEVKIPGFDSWAQLAWQLAPWLIRETRSLDLGYKNQRCDNQLRRSQCPRFFWSCPGLEEFHLKNSDLCLKDLKLLPPTLRVLTILDKRSSIRSNDYCEGLRHLQNLERMELTIDFCSQIEGKLKRCDIKEELELVLPDETEVVVRRHLVDSDEETSDEEDSDGGYYNNLTLDEAIYLYGAMHGYYGEEDYLIM